MALVPVTIRGFVFLVGEITLVILIGLFVLSLVLVWISIISINTGRLFFPRFVKAGMVFVEVLQGTLPALRVGGQRGPHLLYCAAQLHEQAEFRRNPARRAGDFFPQCLRSARCPANLSPEGISCKSCGACSIGYWRKVLSAMGYRVFIVPGSSFIKRMVKAYRRG